MINAHSTTQHPRQQSALIATLILVGMISQAHSSNSSIRCSDTATSQKQVYWGDLHVHTAYSLDAYGFGTVATPTEALNFARGQPIQLPGGSVAHLDRPLDFVAITDHAEWLDFLHHCTDPGNSNHPACQSLREHSSPEGGGKNFADFVVPSITKDAPAALAPCAEDPAMCRSNSFAQWQRIQNQVNAANTPCEFTALLGYEWSATRSFSHTHRNVIFRSAAVTTEAIDYIRHPKLTDLFRELNLQCRHDKGCAALTIPHNTNMSDGASFDVLTEDADTRNMRARYERLIEIHQEKGNSECLAPLGVQDESDCNLEIQLTRQSRPAKPSDYSQAEWERMRAGYVRGLLLRGLEASATSLPPNAMPLKLGIVGATDTHSATPGYVEEALWQGSVFGFGNFERNMTRLSWNPGGLTGVWAKQNTRADIFDALHRREVYATSGTRIRLRVDSAVSMKSGSSSCDKFADADLPVPMGGDLHPARGSPVFRIQALADRTPLARIEIIKGTFIDGEKRQKVISVWQGNARDVCLIWRDDEYHKHAPAFWYVRVHEQATPRWSSWMCRAAARCDAFPEADRMVTERAWSSPIWSLP